MASDIARINRPPAVLADGAPILQDEELEPKHPWWVAIGNLVPEPPQFVRSGVPWALLGLLPQARVLTTARSTWVLIADVGPALREVVAGVTNTGPVFGVRLPVGEVLHEHPELPFELADPRIEGLSVTGLWYTDGVWPLSATAVRRFIAAELRLEDADRTPFTHWQRDPRWISLPATFLWRPDAGELLGHVLLKLLLWHEHPRVLEWASQQSD